jgi:hypothetical protein
VITVTGELALPNKVLRRPLEFAGVAVPMTIGLGLISPPIANGHKQSILFTFAFKGQQPF